MIALLEAYGEAVTRLLPMIVCAIAGFYWGRRKGDFPTEFVSKLVTSLAVPALVFHTLMTTPLPAQALVQVLVTSILCLLAAGVVVAGLLWAMRLPVSALGQTAWIPNAGNLGLPMATLVFGFEGLSVAIAFFAVSSLLNFTLGLRWLTGSSGKAIRQPVVWATLVAVGARAVELPSPDWVLQSADLLGGMAVPLMLLTLGHALSQLPRDGYRLGIGVAVARFASGALIAGVLWLTVDLDRTILAPIALQLLMPCAVNSYMFARIHGTHANASAGGVLVSTLAFLLFAPFVLWFAMLS
jgi:malate permease and related proteins